MNSTDPIPLAEVRSAVAFASGDGEGLPSRWLRELPPVLIRGISNAVHSPLWWSLSFRFSVFGFQNAQDECKCRECRPLLQSESRGRFRLEDEVPRPTLSRGGISRSNRERRQAMGRSGTMRRRVWGNNALPDETSRSLSSLWRRLVPSTTFSGPSTADQAMATERSC